MAKHYADRVLQASGLNYTIVRPGGLLNDPGTGKVIASENLTERGSVPREDVATTVVSSLTEENTYKRAFDLVSGEMEIGEALKKCNCFKNKLKAIRDAGGIVLLKNGWQVSESAVQRSIHSWKMTS